MSQKTADKEKVPVITQVRQMGSMFWIANGSEALERLAFFGVRAVLPLYMFGSDSVLHLSMTEKGIIFGVWALIQCLLPMVSGGYTEAYGYRKSLVIAFGLNTLGYILMANIVTLAGDSHWGCLSLMMAAACMVGTRPDKNCLARRTTSRRRSIRPKSDPSGPRETARPSRSAGPAAPAGRSTCHDGCNRPHALTWPASGGMMNDE